MPILAIFSMSKYIHTCAYTLRYFHAHSSMKKDLKLKKVPAIRVALRYNYLINYSSSK